VLSGSSDVSGVVYFSQGCLGHAASATTVSGTIKGLDASSSRGFHVHELGDATDGCMSSGSHYNPLKFNHGAPSDHKRHVGDLGNIKSNSSGIAEFSFEDRLLSLKGPFSILGRTVVVHEGTDDLGKGNYSDSLTTGHAGGRAACGVIGTP
ncbi:cytosolic copper-zinc superoxide dismutase, partial [Sistotremastrum niveocremeum HHB9708]